MKIAFVNPNLSRVVGQNIGLAYVISSVARQHTVKLWDLTFHARDYQEYLAAELQTLRPQVIGVSANSFNFPGCLKVAAFIKKLYPQSLLLWGGVHPTLMPEEVIQHPLVDALCVGEGEIATLEYLKGLEQGDLSSVAGIWYKDKQQLIHRGLPRAFKDNLDALPFPDWSYWDIARYLQEELFFAGGLRHLASRGCPYRCTFCSNAALSKTSPGRYYRVRTPANVITEIKLNVQRYAAQGLKSIFMSDDIFGLDAEWLKEFCRLYMQAGLNAQIPWACTTRVDILTPHWAKTAAAAGCLMVSLGIESGDERIRRAVYKKEISDEQISNAVHYLKANGILCHISLIVGAPQETPATINKTLRLAKTLNPLTSQYIFYQPLPKTELLSSISPDSLPAASPLTYLNQPLIFTPHLPKKILFRIKRRIECERLVNFFKQGIRQQGGVFFLQLLKFFLSLRNFKKIIARDLHIMTNLEQDILFSYGLKRWKIHNRVK